MSEHDYHYENWETPNLNTATQVEFLESRLFNIMAAQRAGFGLNRRERDEEALIWSQIMLDDLLSDLKFGELSPSFEYDDGTKVREDIHEFALFAVSAIAAAPNLERRQKTKLLADYPDLLCRAGFSFTKHGARSRVSRNLRENEPILVHDLIEHRNLVKAVELRWRQQRFARRLGYLGAGTPYKYDPNITE